MLSQALAGGLKPEHWSIGVNYFMAKMKDAVIEKVDLNGTGCQKFATCAVTSKIPLNLPATRLPSPGTTGSYNAGMRGNGGQVASGLLYWRLRHATIHCERRHHSSVVKTWRAMQHVLIPLVCLVVARALMVASLSAFLPTFMVAQGRSLWFGGTALALVEFGAVLGTMVSGTLSDRLGRRFVLIAAMIASPVLMLIFLVTPAWALFPVLVLLGFNAFATAPVMLAIVQDHAHGMRATANGIYMGINFLVVSGVTVLVGWTGDLLGLGAAFAWSALLALLGVPVIYFLPRSKICLNFCDRSITLNGF